MLNTIFILSFIILAAISDLDSTWSLEDDPLFSNTELPSMNSDQSLTPLLSNAPLFNSAQTFEDAVSSTSNNIDTSDAFLWDLDSSIFHLLSKPATTMLMMSPTSSMTMMVPFSLPIVQLQSLWYLSLTSANVGSDNAMLVTARNARIPLLQPLL